MTGTRGRGKQMIAGACEATGDVLWFLHSGTLAPPDAAEQIETALQPVEVVGGHFRIHFEGSTLAARIFSATQRLYYSPRISFGDSGIFVRRRVFDEMRGFHPWPLFEDVDLDHAPSLDRQVREDLVESGPVVCETHRKTGISGDLAAVG